jgi:hypothetical protein
LLVCNWLHSVGQNHFFVMMFFIRDLVSFRAFIFRVMKILHIFQVREIGSLTSIWTLSCQSIIHPDYKCREASNCSWLYPSGCLSNTAGRLSVFNKEKDFVPKHRYGKTTAIARTMCVPIQMLSLIRQVMHTKFNRPNVTLHGPNAQALIWK